MKLYLLLGITLLLIMLYMSREHFTPDSRVLPPCPLGTVRGNNGLDCLVKGDNLGH